MYLKKPGFALFDVMIAVGIMAVLMALLLPAIRSQIAKWNAFRQKSTLNSWSQKLMQYQVDTGRYPAKLEELLKGAPGEPAYATEKDFESMPEGMFYSCPPRQYPREFKKYEFFLQDESTDPENWIRVGA